MMRFVRVEPHLFYQGQPLKSMKQGPLSRPTVTALTEWEFVPKKSLLSVKTGLN
jgi:hypothetical protein